MARAGIAGYFEDFNPLLNASNSSYIHRVSWEAGGTVPEYTPLADSHAVLQPAIYIPRSSDERAMIIHLAHPSSIHRFVFIREHMKNIAPLPLFTWLFWILVQSWGVSALPPSTCALWGIHILQVRLKLVTVFSDYLTMPPGQIWLQETRCKRRSHLVAIRQHLWQ